MDVGLEAILVKQFPWIVSKDTGKYTKFDCGNGWFILLWELLEEIQDYYEQSNIDINEISLDQIKEKYGGLRFEVRNALHDIYDIIARYENKSESICEICGKQESVYENNGWKLTFCSKCSFIEGYTKP